MDLPDGWQWKKLGEAAQINPRPSKLRQDEDLEVSFIPMKCVKEESGEIDLSEIKPYKDVKKGFTSFENGDVIFAKITPCMENGKIAVVENLKNGVGFGSTEFHVFRCSPILNNKLLFYFLLQKSFRDEAKQNFAGAVGQQRVPKKFLENYLIPIPPPNAQQKIISKIEAAFSLLGDAIERQKQNIQRIEGLKRAVLEEVFDSINGKYVTKKLSFFDKIVAGGTPSRQNGKYWNGDINWFTSGELNTHYVVESKEKISELGLQNSNAKIFPEGTLLVGMYDTAALKMSILSLPSSCNQAIVGIKPKKEILNIEFLKFHLEYLRPAVLQLRQGVRQQNLNGQKIKDIEIFFPDIMEQQNLVSYLNHAFAKSNELLSAQQARLSHLEELKKSILAEAFRGQF